MGKKPNLENPHSPHIHRIIFRIIWFLPLIGLTSFLIVNQNQLGPQDQDLARVKAQLAQNPHDAWAHLELARYHQNQKNFDQAEQEAIIAVRLADSKQARIALEQIRELKNEPQRIASDIKKFEDLVVAYPNYRDGYFRLAVLYWQNLEDGKSRWALGKTLAIDPAYEPALKFGNLID